MAWRTNKLKRPDGAEVQLYESVPEAPKAILHINHGMVEHGGRYERFANALNAAGYGAIAHDHRGHGHTTAPDAPLGTFSKSGGWQKVIGDVKAVNDHVSEHHPDIPRVIFGHSMGAILSLNYLLHHPQTVSGAILWNASVDTGFLGAVYKAILKTQRMFLGSDVPSGIAKKLTFETWNKEFAPNRTDFDWLTRDVAEVDKYIADPLCGFDVTIGLWLDLVEGLYFASNDQNLGNLPKELPIHLQAGALDPCSDHGKAMERIANRMQAQGMKDISFNLLEETRHESLNELNRDVVTSDLIRWLDERFG